MFRHILLPLDGSPLAEAALPHAAALATAFDAGITLLRVIPVRQRGGAAPMDMIDRRLGQAEATAYLDAVAAPLRGRQLPIDSEILEGHPAERIIEVLRRREADLVVLTSHGTGGCTEFPISGTAHKVISRAGISVCLVPTSDETVGSVNEGASAPLAATYHTILVGLDGSRRGEWALGVAAALARHVAAELVLAHVVQVPETVEEPVSPELREATARLVRLNHQAASLHLAQARARLESSELAVRTRIETSSSVSEALARMAESERADLVVLTAHGASVGTPKPYGATTVQVLAEARRPVLVAQDMPRRAESSQAQAGWRATALNYR
jgi:nucleotide-binding universal stress UspA family protein